MRRWLLQASQFGQRLLPLLVEVAVAGMVLAAFEQSQIRQPVVGPLAVAVVDDFMGHQQSPKMSSHEKSMLRNVTTLPFAHQIKPRHEFSGKVVSSDGNIAVLCETSPGFPSTRVAFSFTGRTRHVQGARLAGANVSTLSCVETHVRGSHGALTAARGTCHLSHGDAALVAAFPAQRRERSLYRARAHAPDRNDSPHLAIRATNASSTVEWRSATASTRRTLSIPKRVRIDQPDRSTIAAALDVPFSSQALRSRVNYGPSAESITKAEWGRLLTGHFAPPMRRGQGASHAYQRGRGSAYFTDIENR